MGDPQKSYKHGQDTENRHLVGMPKAILDDPRTKNTGWLEPLCKRCAAIPWAGFYKDIRFAANGDSRPAIAESTRELMQSACRMCRLLASIRPFGWLKFIGCAPAIADSQFKGRLCFFPGEDVKPFPGANPDLYGYLGIWSDLERHLPFPRPNPEYVDFGPLKGWTSDCNASHDQCEPDDSRKLVDLRVIDCETRECVMAPERCDYVALSYVWGPPTPDILEYIFPNLPKNLPPTIEDAMIVTRHAGLRYVWIDRYCIDQKDEDHKMKQIRQMGQIYSSAKLTIIAAAGEGPLHGLPGVTRPRPAFKPKGEVVGSVALVCTKIPAVQDAAQVTWATRGWTFQEGYLSRRRLIFTDTALMYVCNKDIRGDVLPGYTLGDINAHWILQQFMPRFSPGHAVDEWNVQSQNLANAGKQLKGYSLRRLTFDSDSLNAVLGILDQLAKVEDDPVYHTWGVPLALYSRNFEGSTSTKISHEFALGWYHEHPARRRDGFPSWSPIGWDGPVTFSHQDQLMVPDDIDIRILISGGELPLADYVASGQILRDSGVKEAPRRLKLVNVLTFPITFMEVEEGLLGAILGFDQNIDVLLEIDFDELGHTAESSLLGAVIYNEPISHRTLIMVLVKRNDYYERAGFIILDEDVIDGWKLADGYVRDSITENLIFDVQVLKERLKRPLKFRGERRCDVLLA